ncbi:MAG: hypothetical protein JW969_20725 [Spirochaetales bacterium]|nr:hypothetical protein [Spirochaetales bacterium]
MDAYIISISNGLVQIGDKIFQPNTGKIFPVKGDEVHKYAPIKVEGATMEDAKKAIAEYLRNS